MSLYNTDDSRILASFKEWFDHVLLDEGQAYRNVSARLYEDQHKRLGESYTTYTSPYPQWVYDSSITGASIPTGVTGDPDHPNIPRGASGMRFDFRNGGVIFDGGYRNDLLIETSFAVRDINSYITTQPDEKLVFETKFEFNPGIRSVSTGVPMDSIVAPAAFIKSVRTQEEGHCLGGMNRNYHNIRVILVSNSELQLIGVGDLFKSKVNKCFKVFSGNQLPLDEFNDIKSHFSGSWNYDTQAAIAPNTAHIESALFYPENGGNLSKSPHVFVGILEMRVFTVR